MNACNPKDTQTSPLKLGSAYSISLPTNLLQAKEYINTKEMRVVEQALLCWGRKLRGKSVIVHVDNCAVFHALENETIRGNSMDILRRCSPLAAE